MSGFPALPAGWLAGLAARLDRLPARPRVPLRWASHVIGSVEPEWIAGLHAAAPQTLQMLRPATGGSEPAVELAGGDLTDALNALAGAMHAAGFAHAWRDEQLAVTDEAGVALGSIERAAVRPLGIATQAVHLVGRAADGRHWVQQRAFDKATDPGLWDTLMGGMVPAGETVPGALARETWEEAGLRLHQLQAVRRGGEVLSRGPSAEVPGGYVVERIDWYSAVLPDGLVPANQDGEVAQFQLLPGAELARRLVDGAFTLEAAGVLAAAAG